MGELELIREEGRDGVRGRPHPVTSPSTCVSGPALKSGGRRPRAKPGPCPPGLPGLSQTRCITVLNMLLGAQFIHLILSKLHEVKAGVPTLWIGKLSPRGSITCSSPAAAEWRRPNSGCVTTCLQVSGSPTPHHLSAAPPAGTRCPAVDKCVRASPSELCRGEVGSQQGASRGQCSVFGGRPWAPPVHAQ